MTTSHFHSGLCFYKKSFYHLIFKINSHIVFHNMSLKTETPLLNLAKFSLAGHRAGARAPGPHSAF